MSRPDIEEPLSDSITQYTSMNKPHPDTLRLNAIIDMATNSDTSFNCDFAPSFSPPP